MTRKRNYTGFIPIADSEVKAIERLQRTEQEGLGI